MTPGIEDDYEALIQFLYLAPIGLLQARVDGEILMVNPLCAQWLMPLSRDGELANLYTALEPLAPDLRSRVQDFAAEHGPVCDALQLQVTGGAAGRAEHRILSLTLLKLDAGRLMAVISDVTQSVRRDRELRQSQAWINALVNGLTDYALVTLDARGLACEWNPSIGRVTGFGRDAVLGRSYAVFYPADGMSPERAQDRLHDADTCGWSLDEGWRLRADGSRYWGSCLIAPLGAPGGGEPDAQAGHGYSLILRDVSDRREATESLRRAVACDHLTGLANRRAFFEAAELELQRWARSPRPLSLIVVDADHFKRINDEHGHAAGDAVLRHLAAGLSAGMRAMDVVARLGGEEFVALLPGTPLDGAEAVATRLCAALSARAVEIDGLQVRCTISAGVAAMDADITDLDALIKRADAAMYLAKANGRNRVERWQPGLDRRIAAPAVG